MAFVEFEKVSKIYHTGAVEIPALRDATFQVEKGEICVIVGASGAGKTTLLNILGGMDTLTGGTVKLDDREPLKQGKFLKNIKGKLCADKGYIGQALFENLFLNGIQLVTKVKNNMRNSLMSIADRILLRKRALIETVNDELKNIAQIEHSRHRSFSNFIANSLSAIAAYCFFEKKPAIEVNFINDGQLTIF